MIQSRPFLSNPKFGLTRTFHYDDATNQFHIQTQFEVEKDLIQSRFNMYDERTRWDDVSHVAHIPGPIYYQLKAQGILDDEKRFKAWLNSRDNNVFRTRPGHL